ILQDTGLLNFTQQDIDDSYCCFSKERMEAAKKARERKAHQEEAEAKKQARAWQGEKMKWKPGFVTVHFQTGSLHENCKFPSGLSDEYGKRFRGRPFKSPLFLDKNSDSTTIIFSHKLLLLIHLSERPDKQFKHKILKV
ncbi:MAG: hypothetical protein V8Q79_04120, partial [Christensenellales bacterium]